MCAVCETDKDEWLGADEAAKHLGIHIETLRRRVRRGEIQQYKRAHRVLYKRSDLDEYLTPKPA